MSFIFDINNDEIDFEVEDLEQKSFVVKKEVAIFSYVYEKKKKLDTGFPSLFVKQQGEFNPIFQDPFLSLLEIPKKEVFGIYLGIISEHNSLEKMSFEVGVKFMFVLSSQRPFIFFLSTSIQRVQTINKILIWLHWIFEFT